jgi:hypothetical protein
MNTPDFEYVKNFPYDPRKADRWDMLALLIAEERHPDCNIIVRNRHGIGVCGARVSPAARTIYVDMLL